MRLRAKYDVSKVGGCLDNTSCYFGTYPSVLVESFHCAQRCPCFGIEGFHYTQRCPHSGDLNRDVSLSR